jgi:biopolymer transport protein ExbD
MVTEPNVVPMIDVLLVLLIIFMLATAEMVRRAFELQLPQPAQGTASGTPPLVLSVAPGPEYVVNGQRLAPDRLESELRTIFTGRNERILFVKGDRAMRYQDIVRAFDAARGAGVKVTAIVPWGGR